MLALFGAHFGSTEKSIRNALSLGGILHCEFQEHGREKVTLRSHELIISVRTLLGHKSVRP